MDGSASKFVFKDVVPGVQGYSRLVGAIDWLRTAGLILKHPIVNKAWLPLSAYADESIFKLYLFDVGMLGTLGGLSPKVLLDFDFGSFKGYFAENFALQEMVCAGIANAVSWRENTAEVEFLVDLNGRIVPVEIKSGWVTKAKRLKVFAEKYHPICRIIMSGKNFSRDTVRGVFHVPLYLAGRMKQVIEFS